MVTSDVDGSVDTGIPLRNNRLLSIFRKEPAVALTAAYLLISACGLLYEWLYYNDFGLNVFQYADASDFFLAVFREPEILLFASVIAVAAIAIESTNPLMRQGAKLTGWRGGLLYIAVLTSTLLIYFVALNYAHIKATYVKNEAPLVNVFTSGRAAHEDALIGSAGNFLFFYDRTANRTVEAPYNSVQFSFRTPR